jgi:integrase
MQCNLHIRKRGTTYHYRRKIPAEISNLIGSREVVRSLRTGQYQLACTRARSVSVICDRIFEAAHRMPTMSKLDIDTILDKWLEELLTSTKDDFSNRDPLVEEYSDTTLEDDILETQADDYRLALSQNKISMVSKSAHDFCKKYNINPDEEPEAFHHLSQGLLLRTAKYSNDVIKIRADVRIAKLAEKQKDIWFSVQWDAFLKHQEQESLWAGQYISQSRATARMFIESAGDKPVTSYTGADLTNFYNVLRRLPSLYSKDKRFRDQPLSKMAEIADSINDETIERMNPTTVKRHFNVLKGFFDWPNVYALNGSKTIFDRFRLPKPKQKKIRARDQRQMWSDEKLTALFTSPIWAGCKNDARRAVSGSMIFKDERYWIPLIGILQGMRLEEICQLHVDDIKCEQDIWFFDINDAPPRKLKNASSIRRVPIHCQLIDLGFLEYLDKLKQMEKDMLFPNLKSGGKDGKYSHYFTKQFGAYRRSIELYEKLLDFHSFRHTTKTKLLNKDVKELVTDELLGHENPKRGELNRYFKGYDLKTLKEAVDKVENPFPPEQANNAIWLE